MTTKPRAKKFRIRRSTAAAGARDAGTSPAAPGAAAAAGQPQPGQQAAAASAVRPAAASSAPTKNTATGGAPDWRLLQSLGADGFVVKPIDPVSLIALVRRTIDPDR